MKDGVEDYRSTPDGRQWNFVLLGADMGEVGTGVYMHVISDFRGEYGALWHIDMTCFRTKLL